MAAANLNRPNERQPTLPGLDVDKRYSEPRVLHTHDFTKDALGTVVRANTPVIECPVCGKPCVYKRHPTADHYVHQITWYRSENGKQKTATEKCVVKIS